MIVMDGEEFLTAQEACEKLAIKPATLYAYVSRGLLGSYRQGIRRTRLYRRAEIERLTRLRGPEARDGEFDQRDIRGSDVRGGDVRGERDDSPSDPNDPAAWIPYV
jgi:excisionase family DNA binding protein